MCVRICAFFPSLVVFSHYDGYVSQGTKKRTWQIRNRWVVACGQSHAAIGRRVRVQDVSLEHKLVRTFCLQVSLYALCACFVFSAVGLWYFRYIYVPGTCSQAFPTRDGAYWTHRVGCNAWWSKFKVLVTWAYHSCMDLPGDRYHPGVRLSSTESPRVSFWSHLGHIFLITSQASVVGPWLESPALFFHRSRLLLDRTFRITIFWKQIHCRSNCVRKPLLLAKLDIRNQFFMSKFLNHFKISTRIAAMCYLDAAWKWWAMCAIHMASEPAKCRTPMSQTGHESIQAKKNWSEWVKIKAVYRSLILLTFSKKIF